MASLLRLVNAIKSVLVDGNILFLLQAFPNVADSSVRDILGRLRTAREALEDSDYSETPGEEDLINHAIYRIREQESELLDAVESMPDLHADFERLPVELTGRRGRPRLGVPFDDVVECFRTGSTWKRIREHAVPCSQSTLQRRRREYEAESGTPITPPNPFTTISDADLDSLVRQLARRFPFCGQVTLASMLQSEHRVRVSRSTFRESLRRVDGFGFAERCASDGISWVGFGLKADFSSGLVQGDERHQAARLSCARS